MTCIHAPSLLARQVKNLFVLDESRRLARVNERGPSPPPRMFLGRTTQGNAWWFRHNLPVNVRRSLEAVLAAEPVPLALGCPPRQHALITEILSRHAPIRLEYRGPAFVCEETVWAPSSVVRFRDPDRPVLANTFPDLAADLDAIQPCMAVLADGVPVSACFSARTSPAAAEAGVTTLPAYRGRGYATSAVSAWVRAIHSSNRAAFYGTTWTNTASLAIARKLKFSLFAENWHLT